LTDGRGVYSLIMFLSAIAAPLVAAPDVAATVSVPVLSPLALEQDDRAGFAPPARGIEHPASVARYFHGWEGEEAHAGEVEVVAAAGG